MSKKNLTRNVHADSKQEMTEGYLPWPRNRHVRDVTQRQFVNSPMPNLLLRSPWLMVDQEVSCCQDRGRQSARMSNFSHGHACLVVKSSVVGQLTAIDYV